MCSVILVLSAFLLGVNSQDFSDLWAYHGEAIDPFRMCAGNDSLVVFLKPSLIENQYQLIIRQHFSAQTVVFIRFEKTATITLENDSVAKIKAQPNNNKSFAIHFLKTVDGLNLRVNGSPGTVPYVESLIVKSMDYCDGPKPTITQEVEIKLADDNCGRRKVTHNELIVNGFPTKSGDWPWHVAIYRFERSRIEYICGGTLLSKYFVLTAAHCVATRGLVVLPETRHIVLGKYNLVGGDLAPQEKEVHKIIMHENFDGKTLDKDIALMKMTTAVEFTDYVQPACLWSDDAGKRLPQRKTVGTVVGWGFNHTDSLSPTLQQVTLPMQSETTCIKSNPLFFSKKLDRFKFCAGYTNGTSVCNGDSGGGFHIFVPDQPGNESPTATGAWLVRGIVSFSVRRYDAAICDPNSYALFTDIAKFTDWIEEKLKD